MNTEQQRRYDAMRREGLSHNLAIMFALQQAPSIRTDSTFLAGLDDGNGSQWAGQEHIADMYKAEAAAAGVDVKGKVYLGALAEYPGDPRAWVANRGDIIRVCEERGWGCQGAVTVKAQEPIEAPREIRLADDIVDNEVAKVLEHIPEQQRPYVDTVELREQIVDKMAPPRNWGEPT